MRRLGYSNYIYKHCGLRTPLPLAPDTPLALSLLLYTLPVAPKRLLLNAHVYKTTLKSTVHSLICIRYPSLPYTIAHFFVYIYCLSLYFYPFPISQYVYYHHALLIPHISPHYPYPWLCLYLPAVHYPNCMILTCTHSLFPSNLYYLPTTLTPSTALPPLPIQCPCP